MNLYKTAMFCDFDYCNMSWSMLKMKIAWVVERRKFHGKELAISLAFSIWVQIVVASAAVRVSLLLFLFWVSRCSCTIFCQKDVTPASSCTRLITIFQIWKSNQIYKEVPQKNYLSQISGHFLTLYIRPSLDFYSKKRFPVLIGMYRSMDLLSK